MLAVHPFDALFHLQRALDDYADSSWLGSEGRAAYPPINIFRKGEDYVVVAELPGVAKADIALHVKNNTLRLAGTKRPDYPEGASVHRRERGTGQFDRTVTLPINVDADRVKAEFNDGILAIYLPRAEADKPRTIAIQ